MRAVKNEEHNNWKIVMIKTIEARVPIYYRLANLSTYDIITVPAYRLLDEIVNDKKNIVNLKLDNNRIVIINEDGYDSTDEIVIVDEFDEEIPNLFEWSIRNGTEIISRYDIDKNSFSPSNYKIDSMEKLYWTCENGHTIHCGFPTYYSTKCKCPICEIEERGETPSLKYWAHITDNSDILKEYEEATKNDVSSEEISWKSRKKVRLKRGDEEVQEVLYNLTVKNMEPPFVKNKKHIVSLNKHRK